MELNCLIVDDVLPQNKADELEELHTSPEVPWFYNEDIAIGSEVNKTPGFNHTSILDGKIVSRFYVHHHWCPEIILRKIEFREKHTYILIYIVRYMRLSMCVFFAKLGN